MPWLVIHIALPATLLAAALLGEAWERWRPVASGTGEPVRTPGGRRRSGRSSHR